MGTYTNGWSDNKLTYILLYGMGETAKTVISCELNRQKT